MLKLRLLFAAPIEISGYVPARCCVDMLKTRWLRLLSRTD